MRLVLVSLVIALLLPAVVRAESTVSLKAVARNGVPIPPTNNLTVSPGDEVTAEMYVSGWSNPPFDGGSGQLFTYQLTLYGINSVQSGSCGLILPVGWDAPIERDQCPCHDPRYPTCTEPSGRLLQLCA